MRKRHSTPLEVRTSLSRAQLKHMHAGGLYSIQPGVESLSTHVLRLMRKHTTGMRNLELIKWCTYYGINNLYNILVRFPGERAEDYRLHCDIIPKIHHWQPPYAVAKARADRGSPMFTEPETQSITHSRLRRQHFYSQGSLSTSGAFLYFSRDGRHRGREGYDELFRAPRWERRVRERPPQPRVSQSGRRFASKTVARARVRHIFSDERAALDEFGGEARSRKELTRASTRRWDCEALAEFDERELMVHIDNHTKLAMPGMPASDQLDQF